MGRRPLRRKQSNAPHPPTLRSRRRLRSTLSNLNQLRVLSLHNNSLTGTIPDLTGLFNLKSLFLHNNHFTGSLPPSLFSLHKLRTLNFSHNNLSDSIPTGFTKLQCLYLLRLSWNNFNSTIPPLNQSSLRTFDVSGNNLTGAIPVTPTLLFRFDSSSFALNPGLCGGIIHKECHPSALFFKPVTSMAVSPPPAMVLGQSAEVHGVNGLIWHPYQKRRNRTMVIIGFSTGVFGLVVSLVFFAVAVKRQRKRSSSKKEGSGSGCTRSDVAAMAEATVAMQVEQERELEEKVKRAQMIGRGLLFLGSE